MASNADYPLANATGRSTIHLHATMFAPCQFSVRYTVKQPRSHTTTMHAKLLGRNVAFVLYAVCSVCWAADATHSPVLKIYVDSLGQAEGSDVIREKLINRLIKSRKVSVVDAPQIADVILTGLAERSRGVRYAANSGTYGASAVGGTTYDATIVVRLIDSQRQVLWTDEAKPSFFGSSSVSSNVANRVADDLLKAIESGKVRMNHTNPSGVQHATNSTGKR